MWGWSRSSGGCSAVVFVLGTLEIGPSSMTAANGDTDSWERFHCASGIQQAERSDDLSLEHAKTAEHMMVSGAHVDGFKILGQLQPRGTKAWKT